MCIGVMRAADRGSVREMTLPMVGFEIATRSLEDKAA